MIICSECGEPITTRDYWKRYREGKTLYICNYCASCMIDEHTSNGLLLVIGNNG